MNDLHLGEDDVLLMLNALESLRGLNLPPYLDSQVSQLQLRISNHMPQFTGGELRNICLGLENLLSKNPLDWKASSLLSRLQAIAGHSGPHSRS